jgi:RNA polymerase sigma-70 factor (ECF subfamily)
MVVLPRVLRRPVSLRHCYDGLGVRKVTVDERDWPAERFEEHRAHLRAVAYRMLGSLTEADDAVQEAWLRLARTDAAAVENLGGWLTTVVSRICLDMLRTRTVRREQPLDVHVPDPILDADTPDPADEAVLADSVGLALLVVLDTLSPSERLAFVLHDVFAVPFDEIGPILDRSTDAAKQLASRARRRLAGVTVPDTDRARQREVVSAFLAAARDGDFGALLDLLDPDVVLRGDAGAGPLGPSRIVRGAAEVAGQAMHYTALARFARPVLVNGAPGYAVVAGGRILAVLGLTVRRGRVVEINILADPERLRHLRLPGTPEEPVTT